MEGLSKKELLNYRKLRRRNQYGTILNHFKVCLFTRKEKKVFIKNKINNEEGD
jgi:hypothetical protein